MFKIAKKDRTEVKVKKKLPGWVIIPILLVLILIFAGISKLTSGTGKSPQLQVTNVEKGDVKAVYNMSGIVESTNTKVFYSPVNAPILACNAQVGEQVKAGDVLITYDVTNLERSNRESKLNTLSAKYMNQDTVDKSNLAAKSAEQSKAQLASSIQNLQSQISSKEAEVQQLKEATEGASAEASANASKASEIQQKMQTNLNSQSTQKAAKENAERQLACMDRSDPDYAQKSQELVTAAETATNSLSGLEQEYRSLEQQFNQIGSSDASSAAQAYAAASGELENLKASLVDLQNTTAGSVDTGLTGAQVKNMKVTENLAELAQLSTEELLDKGREGIRAEFDGIISDVKAVVGSDAVQGGELFTLVSNKDVDVVLEVPAGDFDNLQIGNKAEIKVGKKTYEGTLDSIDKIALPNEKGNPVIGAKVHIENPDEDIYIGVNAKVSMITAEKKNVLCLPNEVVNTSSEGDFVYVLRDGVVKKQMVGLGVTSDNKVEIISGLKAGDEVVSDVSGDVVEGMKATASKEK